MFNTKTDYGSDMQYSVNLELAAMSAVSLSQAAGLGCILSTSDDTVIKKSGYTCQSNSLCKLVARNKDACCQLHRSALMEAERFGGKYIYYCPCGFGFAVSPIIGRFGCEAKLMAGPFLMADMEDYLNVELFDFLAKSPEKTDELRALISEIPSVTPARVSALSNMLFLAAGFVSSAEEVSNLRKQEASDLLQGQISAYILQTKQKVGIAPYPYDKERELLEAMSQNRQKDANRLLNELLSNILIISGMSFPRMKSHINELLVLMSRKAAENGADPGLIQEKTYRYYHRLSLIQGFEELCYWLTEVANELMKLVFDFSHTRHASAMHRVIYFIQSNMADKLSLEQLAAEAFMSPAYFSRKFREETGKTVQQFIVEARLGRAVELMYRRELSLLEISGLVGIRNQSLFNRLFRKNYGISPGLFRKQMEEKMNPSAQFQLIKEQKDAV